MKSDEQGPRLAVPMMVRLAPEKHEAFKAAAARNERSMAAQLRVLVDDFIADDQAAEAQAA